MYDAYARIFTRLGLEVPRGARRHRRDRRQRVARVPGARRLGRGRDRVLRRRRDYAANVELAEALAPPRRARRRRRKPMAEGGHAGQVDVRGRRRAPRPAARAHGEVPAGRARGERGADAAACAATTWATRSRSASCRASTAGAGRATPRSSPRPAASRASSARSAFRRTCRSIADRTRRGDGRLRLRRQRGRLPPARRQLRPRLPRAGPRRRHPQRRRRATRRPTARARSTSCAASRSATSSSWATSTREAHGRNLSRRRRSVAGHRDGLLRHRRDARRGRRHRAEPRRARHHLAGRRWRRSPWPSRRSATTATRRCAALADRLYDELAAAGIEVLLDDRDERPGVMFADLELIGIPHRITIGDRGLKEGKVEYQGRRDAAATAVPRRGHRRVRCAASLPTTVTRTRLRNARRVAPRVPSLAARSLRRALPAHAGAQKEEQLAPSVVAGLAQGDRRRAGARRLREAAGRRAVARRDVAAHRAQASPTSASARELLAHRALRSDARGPRPAARARA